MKSDPAFDVAETLMAEGRHAEAATLLFDLVKEHPDRLDYCDRLATLLSELGQGDAACKLYEGLIRRNPELAEAHYNLALLFKNQNRYPESMAAYERSVKLGINLVHEVYTNMGVLSSDMRDPDKAFEYFERALQIEPRYVPAIFNLASQYEEIGDRERAASRYRQVLELDPGHWESLARLAYASRSNDRDSPLIVALRKAVDAEFDDALAQESLYFALGKSLDDAGDYGNAFGAYTTANEFGRQRVRPYDRDASENAFAALRGWCDRDWIRNAATDLTDTPIFICGMFRSGSTLIEQILGAHKFVTAGGELPILPSLLATDMSPYPATAQQAGPDDLERLARKYLARKQELFADRPNVTDKRPANHVHLGLIKAMFPQVRILYTVREPLDNCLSVYFQQFSDDLGYAADLADTAHYYQQQARLLEHWLSCMGDNMFIVAYDELVRSPAALLRDMLSFLGLEWDDRCLDFEKSPDQVKTASVWQVREQLYTASSGRWKNYEFALEAIRDQLPAAIVPGHQPT